MATKTLTPEEFVDALETWTVLDVVNAVKLMEDKLGIKAAAPVAAAASPAAWAHGAAFVRAHPISAKTIPRSIVAWTITDAPAL